MLKMPWLSFVVVVLFISYCKGRDYYKAAVVEHHPLTGDSPHDTILKNLEIYKTHIETARKKNVDLIVFPEYGLTTLVDNPQGYALDFSENSTVLQRLKSMALENSIYIVVNLLEEVKQGSKTLYYNTDLVYDKKGQIVAQYRKINLFAEPKLTQGTETVTFTTDFGVTFAIFTCMDILFNEPSRTILKHGKIRNIIFPTAWYSTMPFYTALSVQQGYSSANGVNLLAANYGEPKKGHGGSGIYLANGEIAKIHIDVGPNSTMIVSKVKKVWQRQETKCSSNSISHQIKEQHKDMTDYLTYRDFKAEDYTFKKVDVEQPVTSTTICHHDKFCCNFSIAIKQPSNFEEVYKLMAYDGNVIFDQSPAHIRVCSLLACKNESNGSCGARINSTVKFTEISVEGVLEKDHKTFYTPLTLNYGLYPLDNSVYCISPYNNGTEHVQLRTQQPQKGVLVFGIFGRVET